MALTAAQMEKYGLSKSDATASDHDKGIVAYKDNFYSIDGFERQQKEGVDTDQGDVFSSSLEKDSGRDFTNFNTATDVEGALEALDGVKDNDDDGPVGDQRTTLTPKLAHARARLAQRQEDRISGQIARDLYDKDNDGTNWSCCTDNTCAIARVPLLLA